MFKYQFKPFGTVFALTYGQGDRHYLVKITKKYAHLILCLR
jgi:hypothetical protein